MQIQQLYRLYKAIIIIIQILFVSYNKPTYKNFHLQVDETKIFPLGIVFINISYLRLFVIEICNCNQFIPFINK